MPYKACWVAKDKSFTGIGPVLGKVRNKIFCPFLKEQALKQLKRISLIGKEANYYLAEVKFVTEDFKELRKIHRPFSEALDISTVKKGEDLVIAFFTKNGKKLSKSPLDLPLSEIKAVKEKEEIDPVDSIDSDWKLDSEEEKEEDYFDLTFKK